MYDISWSNTTPRFRVFVLEERIQFIFVCRFPFFTFSLYCSIMSQKLDIHKVKLVSKFGAKSTRRRHFITYDVIFLYISI